MAFTLEIHNKIAKPIRVGFFGIADGTTSRVSVPADGDWSSPHGLSIYSGHRMVVVWDNLDQGEHRIIHSLPVNMQGNTGLNIGPDGIDPFTLVDG